VYVAWTVAALLWILFKIKPIAGGADFKDDI
jgi:hypothetical protein